MICCSLLSGRKGSPDLCRRGALLSPALSAAVFIDQGESVLATELARGPWDPAAQHGGAPAALLMRAFERFEPDPGLMLGRVTFELLRPVPLGELRLTVSP